jgi:hypothetical protein
MEEGYLVDTGDGMMPVVGGWHRGAPVRKWWGLSTSKADKLAITSWRCTGCGLLENYAK